MAGMRHRTACLAGVIVAGAVAGLPAPSSASGLVLGAPVDARTQCAKPTLSVLPPQLRPPPFPFVDETRANPICRLAQWGTIDVPLGSGTAGQPYDPQPACGNYDPSTACFPTAYRNGNARVLRSAFAPSPPGSSPLIPVADSFGAPGDSPRSTAPFAYVEQGSYPGCFNIYDRTGRLRGSTDPRTAQTRCDIANAGRALATIEFQGRGCMVTRDVERRYVIAGILQAPGQPAALNTGLRGFIPLTAVPVAPGVDRGQGVVPQGTADAPGGLTNADFQVLQDAYPGCARPGPPRVPILPAVAHALSDTQLHAADNAALTADPYTGWPSTSFPFLDQYLNATTLKTGCRAQSAVHAVPGCTGFYANYQGPCYAADVAGVAVSSTYVSGTNTTSAENPGNVRTGGVVRAFVRRDRGAGSFAPLDEMPYPDNNVPDAQGALVTWVFGDFNPQATLTNTVSGATGDNREQGIWGWTPMRRPRAAAGHYSC